MSDMEKTEYAVIQSTVCNSDGKGVFVSTLYRRVTPGIQPPLPWYYETLVWEYDRKTGKRANLLWDEQVATDFPRIAMNQHAAICRKYMLRFAKEAKAKEGGD